MSLSIPEARAEKAKLEATLQALLEDFERRTGVAVIDIHIARVPSYALSETRPNSVITGIACEVPL